MLSLVYGFIPLIYKYWREEDWCEERTRLYWISFMGIFMTRFINWILVYTQVIFNNQKLQAKKYILSMLDRNFARRYNVKQYMPLIIDLNPQNTMQMLNLVSVMESMDKMQIEKGEFFVTAIFVVYFIQYLWIGLEVIVRLKTIEEVGELYFIYSIYNMADILYYSVLMMKAGL